LALDPDLAALRNGDTAGKKRFQPFVDISVENSGYFDNLRR